jgi:extensin-like protein
MRRHLPFVIAGSGLLLALAGCGRGLWQYGERASWRHEAEVSCLKSGSVKVGSAVVQIQPIEGPGVCGADFPLKVTALGEASSTPVAYADDIRPPGAIPNASVPRWPVRGDAYAPPPAPNGERMQWITGPQGIARAPEPSAVPEPYAPPGAPLSIAPPSAGEPEADDVPDDAMLPPQTERVRPRQATYQPEMQQQPRTPSLPPPLGPNRIPAAATPVALTPAATLACPIVSALDRWVSEGVQPAALHWFGVPVTQIKQISAYSCREMVGSGTSSISEHAFGNALDIAGFTFADGRTISVVKGWHGTPEEQGFLHDVQLYACETFNTVLAPGYNAAHYNHIHVDLMRRSSGRRPCRPNAVPGEVVAAQARAHYARRGDPGVTGSIDSIGKMIAAAKAGEDGLDEEDAEAPAPKQAPAQSKTGLFDFSGWRMFEKSSLESAGDRLTPN